MTQERTVERRKTESEATPGGGAPVPPASQDEGELTLKKDKSELLKKGVLTFEEKKSEK